MPDIHIRRDHHLGLANARRLALRWAEDAEKKLDMQCSILAGETSDTVTFKRAGVAGELIVAADHFAIEARLGLLLGAFSRTIESEIEKNLDALLAKGAGVKAAPGPAAAKVAVKTPKKR